MEESVETRVIRKFRERVEQGQLTDDVQVTYRVVGGMPSYRLDEEFKLSGRGRVHSRRTDKLGSIHGEETDADLDPAETAALFREIGSTLDGMMPPSQASFGPDSIIGRVTIEVDGEQAILYFDPQESEAGRLAELAMLSAETDQPRQEQAAGISSEPTQARQQQAVRSVVTPVRKMALRVRAVSENLFEHKKEHGNG